MLPTELPLSAGPSPVIPPEERLIVWASRKPTKFVPPPTVIAPPGAYQSPVNPLPPLEALMVPAVAKSG